MTYRRCVARLFVLLFASLLALAWLPAAATGEIQPRQWPPDSLPDLPVFEFPFEQPTPDNNEDGMTIVWSGGPHPYNRGGDLDSQFNYGDGSGLDFARKDGQSFPVLAMAAGRVIRSGCGYAGLGCIVAIRHHEGGTVLIYGHLTEGTLVKSGAGTSNDPFPSVQQGDVLGQAGQSGGQTNIHLHIELRAGGQCSQEIHHQCGDIGFGGDPVGWERGLLFVDGYRITGYCVAPNDDVASNCFELPEAKYYSYDGAAWKGSIAKTEYQFWYNDISETQQKSLVRAAAVVHPSFSCTPQADCEVVHSAEDMAFAGHGVFGTGGGPNLGAVLESTNHANETLTGPSAMVTANGLDVRSGPGTDFARVESVKQGDRLSVTGRNSVCSWLEVVTPAGALGWVSSQFVQLTVACDQVALDQGEPIANAPQLAPANSAAGIDLRCLDCPSQVSPGQKFRPTFSATVNAGELQGSALRGDMLRLKSGDAYGAWPHVEVPGSTVITTGQSIDFTFYAEHPVIAPSAPGVYDSVWQIWRAGSWDGPEVHLQFEVVQPSGSGDNSSAAKHTPNAPVLTQPHDWSLYTGASRVTLKAQQAGDPDGDAVTAYYFELFDSVQMNSGWLTGDEWTVELTRYGRYQWRVKVRDAKGAESAWSPTWNFSVQTNAPEISSFTSQQCHEPWADAEQICFCAETNAGTIKVMVNSATDGSDSGTWAWGQELGSSNWRCTSDSDRPAAWRQLDFESGRHLARLFARRDSGWESAAARDLIIDLPTNRRPNVPDFTSPPRDTVLDYDTVHFDWKDTLRTDSYRLQVATDKAMSNLVFSQTFPASTSEFWYEFDMDYPTLFARVTAVGAYGENSADLQFGEVSHGTAPLPPEPDGPYAPDAPDVQDVRAQGEAETEGFIEDFSNGEPGAAPTGWDFMGSADFTPHVVENSGSGPSAYVLDFPAVASQYWDKFAIRAGFVDADAFTLQTKLRFLDGVADRAGLTLAVDRATLQRIDIQPNIYTGKVEFRSTYGGSVIRYVDTLSIQPGVDYWLRAVVSDGKTAARKIVVYWSDDGVNFTKVAQASGMSTLRGGVGISTAGPNMPHTLFDDIMLTYEVLRGAEQIATVPTEPGTTQSEPPAHPETTPGATVTIADAQSGALVWSADGKTLLMPSDTPGQYAQLDPATGALIATHPLDDNAVALTTADPKVSVAPNGEWAIQGLGTGTCRLTNLDNGREFVVNGVRAAWSPDSSRVAIIDSDENVAIWSVETRQKIVTLESTVPYALASGGMAHSGPFSFEWSPDGQHILYTEFRGSVLCIWNSQSGAVETCAKMESNVSPEAAWAADSKHIAVVVYVGSPTVYDLTTGDFTPLGEISFHVYGAMSPNKDMIAIYLNYEQSMPEGIITVYDVYTGEILYELKGPYANPVWSLDQRKILLDVLEKERTTGKVVWWLDGPPVPYSPAPSVVAPETPATSTANHLLAFNTGTEIYSISSDGTGRTLLVGPAQLGIQDFAWSPDASAIAYIARGGGGESDLMVVDLATGRNVRLAPTLALSPVAWHDTRIAFMRLVADLGSEGKSRLSYVDLRDSPLLFHDVSEEFTFPYTGVAGVTSVSWSSDGTALALQDFFMEPVVYSVESAYPKRTLAGTPTWVPGTSDVTYIDCRPFDEALCSSPTLWRHNMETDLRTRVATLSPDTATLIPFVPTNAVVDASASTVAYFYHNLHLVDLESGDAQQVTSDGVLEAAWSPSGDQLAHVSVAPDNEGMRFYRPTGIWVMDRAGRGERMIVSDEADTVRWQPAANGDDFGIAQLLAGVEGIAAEDGATGAEPPVESSQGPSSSASARSPRAKDNANLRAGPGTNYDRVGHVKEGDALQITGCNGTHDWCALFNNGWIAAYLVDGLPDNLPVVVSVVEPSRPAASVALVPSAPAQSAQACAISVAPALSSGYDNRLGCATAPSAITWASYTPFERGFTFWRQDTSRIYGMFSSGNYAASVDNWDGSSPTPYRGQPPSGLLEPVRGAGYIWGTNDIFFNNLGWATKEQTGFCAEIQPFANGFILRSSATEKCHDVHINPVQDNNFLFITLFSDGGWRRH